MSPSSSWVFIHLKTAPDGWKNSVRHNLSLNKCFEKVENKTSGSSRKGCLWALNPVKIDKMEEEMQKWKRKDLPAIRRSMANPGETTGPTEAHSHITWVLFTRHKMKEKGRKPGGTTFSIA
jgi:hypothetical protein